MALGVEVEPKGTPIHLFSRAVTVAGRLPFGVFSSP